MNYYEETEERLKNYIALKVSIKNFENQIEEALIEDGINGINYEGEKTAETYKITHPTEKVAVRNVIKIDMLKRKIELNKNRLKQIDNTLEALNEVDREIIKLRYIKGHQWYVVAREVKYSESHCRLRAIKAVEKISIALFGEDAIQVGR